MCFFSFKVEIMKYSFKEYLFSGVFKRRRRTTNVTSVEHALVNVILVKNILIKT